MSRVAEALAGRQPGESGRALARRFGLTQQTVQKALKTNSIKNDAVTRGKEGWFLPRSATKVHADYVRAPDDVKAWITTAANWTPGKRRTAQSILFNLMTIGEL